MVLISGLLGILGTGNNFFTHFAFFISRVKNLDLTHRYFKKMPGLKLKISQAEFDELTPGAC